MRQASMPKKAVPWSAIGLSVLIAAHLMHAQSLAVSTAMRSFEAASIKANKSGGRGGSVSVRADRFTARNITTGILIRTAYELQPFQTENSPSWVDRDRLDVVAKTPDGVILNAKVMPERGTSPVDVLNLMLQSLLRERFKLAIHLETKQLPIYELVVLRSNRTLGSSIRPTTVDCAEFRRSQPDAPALPPSDLPICTSSISPGRYAAGN
jgi:uncharacterized protein (TIGR03435 family)